MKILPKNQKKKIETHALLLKEILKDYIPASIKVCKFSTYKRYLYPLDSNDSLACTPFVTRDMWR